ncbi:MAG: tRNA preQ1(34) S-adenosylmethionine ribosyltransferase-isomerase QueA [Betaproteobacteria bacterium]|nr:tRNA preQ1(34) S-adenosylmethionine ribosyltransferase-isomerase QueA [Betaproteobacteria bacterium]
MTASRSLADFDYDLPPELIAQHPPRERSASRLLHLDGRTGHLADRRFPHLLELVNRGDVLVFNDTQVIKARLWGEKASGGKVEVLVERVLDAHRALAHVRASKSPRPGTALLLANSVRAEVRGRHEDLYELAFAGDESVLDQLARHGSTPLPPYITHAPDAEDDGRYQTVYARHPGAVAAPTAGLHFDEALLAALRSKGAELAYVTLHVGAGTFQPVRGDDLATHVMHEEWYRVLPETIAQVQAAKARGGRVLAVGTTAVRTLEAASLTGELLAGEAMTRLFIQPGFRFQTVDRMITNFHLPKSTLLMLVAAFAGHANIRKAYEHAISQHYRFFSYGDAMLLERQG